MSTSIPTSAHRRFVIQKEPSPNWRIIDIEGQKYRVTYEKQSAKGGWEEAHIPEQIDAMKFQRAITGVFKNATDPLKKAFRNPKTDTINIEFNKKHSFKQILVTANGKSTPESFKMGTAGKINSLFKKRDNPSIITAMRNLETLARNLAEGSSATVNQDDDDDNDFRSTSSTPHEEEEADGNEANPYRFPAFTPPLLPTKNSSDDHGGSRFTQSSGSTSSLLLNEDDNDGDHPFSSSPTTSLSLTPTKERGRSSGTPLPSDTPLKGKFFPTSSPSTSSMSTKKQDSRTPIVGTSSLNPFSSTPTSSTGSLKGTVTASQGNPISPTSNNPFTFTRDTVSSSHKSPKQDRQVTFSFPPTSISPPTATKPSTPTSSKKPKTSKTPDETALDNFFANIQKTPKKTKEYLAELEKSNLKAFDALYAACCENNNKIRFAPYSYTRQQKMMKDVEFLKDVNNRLKDKALAKLTAKSTVPSAKAPTPTAHTTHPRSRPKKNKEKGPPRDSDNPLYYHRVSRSEHRRGFKNKDGFPVTTEQPS